MKLPVAGWLPAYRREWLRADTVAGLTAAAVVIPKAMAIAAIAGLPVEIGLYTALAAMLGALFILDDPIFNGLAISLIFGIAVSTLLTLVVIPLLYFAWLRGRARVG
jgi:Cu/Ag efflux pump CusA